MMGNRYRASLGALVGVLAGVLALLWLTPLPIAGQPGASLRTPWGDPDLQGIWHVTTDVPLERPAKYAGREFLTDAEVAALERAKAQDPGRNDRSRPDGNVAGAYNAVFNTILRTGRRTSRIIDPPDGKMPPLTVEGQKRQEAARGRRPDEGGRGDPRYDNPETIPMGGTRCLGVEMPDIPMDVAIDFGFFTVMRLVQAPKSVGIYMEHNHGGQHARIIPVDGSPHIATHIRRPLGDSRGRWEGNTLVVETTNFKHIGTFREANAETFRMIERFTRVDANNLRRDVTFEDPATWTRPWTVVIELGKSDDQRNLIFESACHEGNYGMTGILAGVRAQEKAEAARQGAAK